MKTRIIRIFWSNPIPIEEAVINAKDEKGLYYITRKCRGKETSLYIGKSDISVKDRISWHDKNWVHRYSRSKIYIRFGTIFEPTRVTYEIIDHAEKALIHEHGQYGTKVLCENTQYINSYSYSKVYKIINEGNVFELKPIVDMNDHEDYYC